MYSIEVPAPHNRCRLCGAASYRRVIERDAGGRLRPTGLYCCSGCSVVFGDPKSWGRAAGDNAPPSVAPAPPPAPQPGPMPSAARHGPDLRTYGIRLDLHGGRTGDRGEP